MDLISYSCVLLAIVVGCEANAGNRTLVTRSPIEIRLRTLHNNYNSTYLITSIITLVIVSPRVVTHCVPQHHESLPSLPSSADISLKHIKDATLPHANT
jgi:hypothetical protein